MQDKRQGVRSTNTKKNEKLQGVQILLEGEKLSEKFQGKCTKDTKPIKKEIDILIEVYKPNETMYADQTGKFPQVSSKGNRYMILLANIDSDSICMEAMKNRTEGGMMLAK